MKQRFLHNLTYLRKLNGLTQKEAAGLAGVKLCTYQAWEEGRSGPQLLETYVEIAKKYNVELMDMLTKDLQEVVKTPTLKKVIVKTNV